MKALAPLLSFSLLWGTVALAQLPGSVNRGGGSDGLTDTQLRASPVPVSGSFSSNTTGNATAGSPAYDAGTNLLSLNLQGGLRIDGSAVTQPVSGSIAVSNFPATQAVSGTVTSNAGSGTFAVSAVALPLPTGAATSANQSTLGSQTTKINDGTNTANVKAASTAAVSTDPALVVAISPNNVIPVVGGGVINGTSSLSVISNERAGFTAEVSNVALITGATDIFTLTGSANRTIRVVRIQITAIATVAVLIPFTLLKRSTVDTSGSPTSITGTLLNSNNLAVTATVNSYQSSNPTLGTLVGSGIRSTLYVASSTLTSAAQSIEWQFGGVGDQMPMLVSTSEQIAINCGGTSITGGAVSISIEWTED